MGYPYYPAQPPNRKRGKTLVQTIYDVLHRLVADHQWRNESDRVRAHGIINGSDPNFVPPPQVQQQQNLTPEQLHILQLQNQIAQLTGQNPSQPNAAEQWAAAQAGIVPQPASAASAQPDQMRGYAYPVQAPGQQAPGFPQPQPVGQGLQQPMQQYIYPAPQPQYQPVPQPFQ